MDQKSIAEAVKQICDEKRIPKEAVIETIETALAAAYRKDFGQKNQNIKVTFNPSTGESEVFDVKTVVEAPQIEEAEQTEIALEQGSEKTKKMETENPKDSKMNDTEE